MLSDVISSSSGSESSPGRTSAYAAYSGVILTRIAILLLLFGVAGLATAAKDGQYYPTANPARQVSLSTKMNLNHVPVVFYRTPLEKVARIIAAKPRPLMFRPTEPELLLIEPLAIALSLQHRSPPSIAS